MPFPDWAVVVFLSSRNKSFVGYVCTANIIPNICLSFPEWCLLKRSFFILTEPNLSVLWLVPPVSYSGFFLTWIQLVQNHSLKRPLLSLLTALQRHLRHELDGRGFMGLGHVLKVSQVTGVPNEEQPAGQEVTGDNACPSWHPDQVALGFSSRCTATPLSPEAFHLWPQLAGHPS